ncbi:type II secretion system protein N [Sansalvadorimonas verongulae]|uniref:type II secretion system protein N n=1 Tax=Sansalvadorimonas verongulae TaxID=2172824 RepID=UPI0012BBC681|nr:type II secretion system protein N [Sansalvadorimonas verongulae]MTI14327.1 hypothetical protein [Sansalvadorimonas verongulae]
MNNDILAIGRQWLVKNHRHVLLVGLCTGLISSLTLHSVRLAEEIKAEPPERSSYDPGQKRQTLAANDFQLLFGQANEKPKAQSALEIPATNLNLTLRGALAGIGDVPSSAIIQGNDGQDRLYHPGDTIVRGVTLESIHSRHVVISYNGRLQKLLFPEVSNQGAKPYTPSPPSANTQTKLPPGPLNNVDQVQDLEKKMDSLRRRFENSDDS